MKRPNVFKFKNDERISVVHYEKPIVIPRLPVCTNDRQKEKLYKQISTYIRSSVEYQDFIKYLKDYVNMNECEFFPNIDGRQKRGLIEIHHEPFNMFEIVRIVCTKHNDLYGKINELMVAEEVMRLHYQGITAHELADAGKLPIPLNKVYGKFVSFINQYYEYISAEDLAIIDKKMEITNNLSPEDFSILKVRYLYSDIEGQTLPEVV